MDDLQVLLLVAAGGLVVFGLLLSAFAKPFAAYQRDQVSRALPRRYWAFTSEALAVRAFGVLGAVVGVACGVGVLIAGAS